MPWFQGSGRRLCRERFPRHRHQMKLLFSDPGMHHGTCVTHVPWCISGSLTSGGAENIPGIPGACATHNFTYLSWQEAHWSLTKLPETRSTVRQHGVGANLRTVVKECIESQSCLDFKDRQQGSYPSIPYHIQYPPCPGRVSVVQSKARCTHSTRALKESSNWCKCTQCKTGKERTFSTGTRHNDNVIMTSKRRRDVVLPS